MYKCRFCGAKFEAPVVDHQTSANGIVYKSYECPECESSNIAKIFGACASCGKELLIGDEEVIRVFTDQEHFFCRLCWRDVEYKGQSIF